MLTARLGKCRLCLKLGDFYSLFEDSDLELANMAMACANIQVLKGDGLPDKICTECIEKLSAAYIFKQQCERSDSELRKSLPQSSNPGILRSLLGNDSPDSSKSRSSSKKLKVKPKEEKPDDSLLREQYSVEVEESSDSNMSAKKRRRNQVSDSEDSVDELPCPMCGKRFISVKALQDHVLRHRSDRGETSTPKTFEHFGCESCGKKFRYNIMLQSHYKTCRETIAKVSATPTDDGKSFPCGNCGRAYKSLLKLQGHFTVCQGDRTSSSETPPVKKQETGPVACSNCEAIFPNHLVMYQHFHSCFRDGGSKVIACNTCSIVYVQKNSLYRHIMKNHNPDMNATQTSVDCDNESSISSDRINFKCDKCSEIFKTEPELLAHSQFHKTEATNATREDDGSIKLSCNHCNASFRYEHNLRLHIKNEHGQEDELEDIEKNFGGKKAHMCHFCPRTFTTRNSCDYHMSVKHNAKSIKKSKMAPIAKPINFYNCSAKCLKCNVVLRHGGEISIHNKMHQLENTKIKNRYDCPGCKKIFTNTKLFRAHINLHNMHLQRNKDNSQTDEDEEEDDEEGNNEENENDGEYPEVKMEVKIKEEEGDYQNPMDFCETVVENIKSEPMDYTEEEQSLLDSQSASYAQNPYDTVLSVNLSGFSCTVCHKVLPTVEKYNSHINLHKRTSTKPSTKSHHCLICDQSFTFRSHLKTHFKEHEDKALYDPTILDCTICGRNLKNVRGLAYHMKWHKDNNLKQFPCPVCNKLCVTKAAFVSHQKTHMNKSDVSKSEIMGAEEVVTPFQCYICRKYLPAEQSLKCHIRWHRSAIGRDKPIIECMKCDKIFMSKKNYKIHRKIHFPKVLNKCKLCDRSFNNFMQLKIHLRSHRQPQSYPCAVCDQVFDYRCRLLRHLNKHHSEKKAVKKEDPDEAPAQSFLCKVCGKHFDKESQLIIHGKRHSEKKSISYKCTICNKRSRNLKFHQQHIKGHMHVKLPEEEQKCPHCDSEFERRKDMNDHLSSVHNIVPNYTIRMIGKEKPKSPLDTVFLECHLCRKILSTENTFRRHMDMHNATRCNYCYKYFNNKTFLEAHLMYDCDRKNRLRGSDSFEKKLKCPICHKAFSLVVKLNCHLKVKHNKEPDTEKIKNEKYSVCDFCFSAYSSEEQMLKHRQIHVRPGYFGCKYCPRKFVNLIKFKKHKRNHFYAKYIDEPLSCHICSKKFILMMDMLNHMKSEHNVVDDWVIPPQEPVSEKCTICDKDFTHLANHLAFHEKYKCKKCSEYFMSEVAFSQHQCSIEDEVMCENSENNEHGEAAETEAEIEECEFCFKRLTKTATRVVHMISHSRVCSFACRFCAKTFTSIASFKMHHLAHRMKSYREDPLVCRFCDQTFPKFFLYNKHMLDVHHEKESLKIKPEYPPEECVICKKSFRNIHNHYRYHMEFKCRSCSKYITSESLFLSHKCDDPDEDQSKIFECDVNIVPKTVGMYDYSKHLFKTVNNRLIGVENNGDHNSFAENKTTDDETSHVEDDSIGEFSPRISSTVSLSNITQNEQNE